MPQNPINLQPSKLVALSPMNITDDQIVLAQAKIANIEALNVKHSFLVDASQTAFNAIKDDIKGINNALTFDLDAFNTKMSVLTTLMEDPEAGVLSAFDELYDEMNRRSETVVAVHPYALSTGVLDIDLTDNTLLTLDSYEVSAHVYGQNLVDVRVEKISTVLARAFITDGAKIQSYQNDAISYDGTGTGKAVNILFELVRVPKQITKTFAPDVDGGDEWIAGQGALNFVPKLGAVTLIKHGSILGGVTSTLDGVNSISDGVLTSFELSSNGVVLATHTASVFETINNTDMVTPEFPSLAHGAELVVKRTKDGETSPVSNAIIYERKDANGIVSFAPEADATTSVLALLGDGSNNLGGFSYVIKPEADQTVVASGNILAGVNAFNLPHTFDASVVGSNFRLTLTSSYGFVYELDFTVTAAAGGNAL